MGACMGTFAATLHPMAVYLNTPKSTHYTIEFEYKGRRYRRTSEHATKKRQADAEEAEWRKQVKAGSDPDSLVPMTLAQAIGRYREEVLKPKGDRLLLGTLRTYNHTFVELLDFFGDDMPVSRLTTFEIEKLRVKKVVKDGCKERTFTRASALLGSVLKHCVMWKALHSMPKINRNMGQEHRDIILDRAEEPALLKAAMEVDPDFHDAIVVALDSGARRSCLLRLRKQHILANAKKTFYLKNKTMNPRSVPWTSRVEEIMLRRLNDPSLGDRVFPWCEHRLVRLVGRDAKLVTFPSWALIETASETAIGPLKGSSDMNVAISLAQRSPSSGLALSRSRRIAIPAPSIIRGSRGASAAKPSRVVTSRRSATAALGFALLRTVLSDGCEMAVCRLSRTHDTA